MGAPAMVDDELAALVQWYGVDAGSPPGI